MGSEAETRIRVKAERLLREQFPDARIIHEFDLGGVRLDLAAVTPDRIILLEIKSERDTLKRLANQIHWARTVGGPVLMCFAPRWRDALKESRADLDLWRVEWLEETDDGFDGLRPAMLGTHHDRWDNHRLLGLLLKSELFALAQPYGGKSRQTVPELARIAHDNLTGLQIRRGVCAALRARHFGWTCDEPVGIAA